MCVGQVVCPSGCNPVAFGHWRFDSSRTHMDKKLPRNIKVRGEYSVDIYGATFRHHARDECSGACCFHNPSNHMMVDWPLHWRGDRGIMERLCEHGVGHPDPDDMSLQKPGAAGVHGCDGCCSGWKS